MKGLYFKDQFEVRLEIDGDEFRQGDTVCCTLSVKNRGESALTPALPSLSLVRGESKKVKAKDPEAWQRLETAKTESFGEVAPGESKKCVWSFSLDKNCLITEKSQSLYLLYGLGEEQGQLQLTVLPHEEIEGIVGIFETSFQFLLKKISNKKDCIAATLKAPEGPGYRALSQLELRLRFNEEKGVELQYLFKVERLEASATTLEVQKKKVEFSQSLGRDDFMSSAAYVDPERLEPHIREALSQVTSKFE